jgi:exosome complex RNA-binding protein Rrp42 (RNase PH superfamily)
LCIAKGKYAWRIFVDVTVLQARDNLADAATLAAFAAIQRTRLPRLQVSAISAADGFLDADDEAWQAAVTGQPASGPGGEPGADDEEASLDKAVDVEIEIMDDVDASVPLASLCSAEQGPVSVGFAVVDGLLVVDPLQQEAAGAESEIRVSVCRDGRVVAVSGGAASSSVAAAEAPHGGSSSSSSAATAAEGASGASVKTGDTEPLAVRLTEQAVESARRLAPDLFAAVDHGMEAATRRARAVLEEDERQMRELAIKYGDLDPKVLREADATKAELAASAK